MTLLHPDTDTNADAPAGATPEQAPPHAASCPRCQAPVEPGQDWCLNCGEAQASRRVTLPGKRAAATVLALTTVMVGGAVAASYAALTDGSDAPPPAPTQVAQVPQSPAPPAAAVTPPPSTAVPPSTTAPANPSGSVPPATGGGSSTPPIASTPVTPAPSASDTAVSGATSTGSGSRSGTTTSSSSKGDDTTADTRTSTTEADTEPVAIALAPGAATLYDPFKRDTAAGDPAKALDGNPTTSFPVTVAAGSPQIGAGLTVDLGKKQGVREIDVTTKTPGFKIEIYATDETDLPPDVLDTRWAHLRDVTGLGSDTDGKELVPLGAGTSKYRHVLLWFTAPPTDGTTVRISELKVLG
jgi:hypothetical protein